MLNKDSAANGGGRVINFLYQNDNPFSLFTALSLLSASSRFSDHFRPLFRPIPRTRISTISFSVASDQVQTPIPVQAESPRGRMTAMVSSASLKISKINVLGKQMKVNEKKEEETKSWKKLINIAVSGSTGMISNHLLFKLASGDVFGPNQPITLKLLGSERSIQALEGVAMELEDSLFPLLREVSIGINPYEVFQDAEWALLIGAKPRGPGMEQADLLDINGQIFAEQGKALNAAASPNVKVIVVGNPCNTKKGSFALICMKNAPNIPAKNFHALIRLDENRAKCQRNSLNKNAGLKKKRQLKEEDEEWEGLKLKRGKKETPVGSNPSPDLCQLVFEVFRQERTEIEQMLEVFRQVWRWIRANVYFLSLFNFSPSHSSSSSLSWRFLLSPAFLFKLFPCLKPIFSSLHMVSGALYRKYFKRGGVLIQKWGGSSAASTAVSTVDAIKSLMTPTPEGDWFSSGGDGDYELVKEVIFDDYLLKRIRKSEAELLAEKRCVAHLTGEGVAFCDLTEDTMLPGEMQIR
ncbi:hypothetical protein CRYUN_Cryun01aG0067600 [Craigia yunnanensis]